MIFGPQRAPWTHLKIDSYVADVLSHLDVNPVPFPDTNATLSAGITLAGQCMRVPEHVLEVKPSEYLSGDLGRGRN